MLGSGLPCILRGAWGEGAKGDENDFRQNEGPGT